MNISDPQTQVAEHKLFCEWIWMKGRVYISEEGISATLTGNEGQIMAYKLYLKQTPYFHDVDDLDVKTTFVENHQFDKMIVRYREEIVAMWKVVTQEQVEQSDKQISIEELKRIIDEEDDSRAILDMRNDYEWELGHFKWAIPAWTLNFRDVQEMIKKYKSSLEGKKVVMYCTWWIRCEKLSVLLAEEGVDNFYWLDWWVVKYTNQFDDGNWKGNLYTFDWRVSCPIWSEWTHTTIATCIYTWEKTNNCENCRYSPCNARIIATSKAYRKHFWFCSQECYEKWEKDLLIKNLDWDPVDYKSLRWIIKHDPTQKQWILEFVSNLLKKKTLHAEFKHHTSQKEKVLYDWSK